MVRNNRTQFTAPDAVMPPLLTESGFGAIEPTTVVQKFAETIEQFGDRPALHFKERCDFEPGSISARASGYQYWTWRQYHSCCCAFAKSLIALGFSRHSTINIIGFNAKEWHTSLLGSIMAGGMAAGVYPTNTQDACKYIAKNSQAEILVVEDEKQFQKYEACLSELRNLKAVVFYRHSPMEKSVSGKALYTFEDFLLLGKNVPDNVLMQRIEYQQPGHCCTLIYTSGTTGFPKGCMLSNDNVLWTTQNLCQGHGGDMAHWTSEDRVVSYLPLSHVAGQCSDIFSPMLAGSQVYFAMPDALKGSLVDTLKVVKPTCFFTVPRVWEKIHEKLAEVEQKLTGSKAKLFAWARACGAQKYAFAFQKEGDGVQPTTRAGLSASLQFCLADKLIFSKVRGSIGLAHARCCFSGGAPLNPEAMAYLASMNIPVFEGFGMSECSGPFSTNSPSMWKAGSCGKTLEGMVARLDDKTGELQYRGRHVMMGYLRNPNATSDAFTEDGWFKSGDIVKFDQHGYLTVTGRLKEILVTSGGENVAPVPLEHALKRHLPAVSQAVVVGDGRKFLAALLTLQTAPGPDLQPTERLAAPALRAARAMGSEATTAPWAAQCPRFRAWAAAGVAAANREAVSGAATVKKFTILPGDFGVGSGELTATLKLKRRVVEERYQNEIEEMYAGS